MNRGKETYLNEKLSWYRFPLTFWELVEQLNWKESCNKSLKFLQHKFRKICNDNSYVMKYFNDCRRGYLESLQNTLTEYQLKTYGNRCSNEFFNGGDDSWDDLTNHIIGLGKDIYFDVLNNPENAKKYMDEYTESFAYCFLYDDI